MLEVYQVVGMSVTEKKIIILSSTELKCDPLDKVTTENKEPN